MSSPFRSNDAYLEAQLDERLRAAEAAVRHLEAARAQLDRERPLKKRPIYPRILIFVVSVVAAWAIGGTMGIDAGATEAQHMMDAQIEAQGAERRAEAEARNACFAAKRDLQQELSACSIERYAITATGPDLFGADRDISELRPSLFAVTPRIQACAKTKKVDANLFYPLYRDLPVVTAENPSLTPAEARCVDAALRSARVEPSSVDRFVTATFFP